MTIIIMEHKTTVSLSKKTKEKLASFGAKGEPFDQIMQRVMVNADTLCNKHVKQDDDVASEESI